MAAEGLGRSGSAALIAAAAVVAGADWITIALGRRGVEAVLKPLVPLLLAIAAFGHWWFVAALLLCLLGDVFLLPQVDRFIPGLIAFLLGHLAFVGGLFALGFHPGIAVVVLPLLLGYGVVLLPRLTRESPQRLRLPIRAYTVVILSMGAAAALTGRPIALAGAVLFIVSDSLLAWQRFRGPLGVGRLGVMVTYHLALGLLTIAAWT